MNRAAKRAAVEGQLTPTKRVVYADGADPVEFIGFRLRGTTRTETFVELDPTTGEQIARHRFDHADLLYEESLE